MRNRLMLMLFFVFAVINLVAEQHVVFVSLLPQKYFVERVAGDDFDVEVMVRPGQSPATYEPTPRQMVELSKASLYFSIGVPFEKIWLPQMHHNNPDLKIVDTNQGVTMREVNAAEEIVRILRDEPREQIDDIHDHHDHHDQHNNHQHKHHPGEMDPHTWLSPENVKIQTGNILKELIKINPDKKAEYIANFNKFKDDLIEIQAEISETFSGLESKKFLVFHPAWGYFAEEFGLEQIPIEIEGKDPTPKEMMYILKFCKSENIRTIFVQRQFSQDIAKSIAEELDGNVLLLDPLAEDYLANLSRISQSIAEVLGSE